jgi:FkbM family methyltransferase
MDVLYIVKDFIKCKGRDKEFLKNRLGSLDYLDYQSVPKKIVKYIGTDYAKFYLIDGFNISTILEQVEEDYSVDDVSAEDIVLDIGANFGGFTLRICNKVKHVYSVEPLFVEELNKNIELNGYSNVTVLPFALSNEDLEIEFGNKKRYVKSKNFSELKKLCGGHIDFLKMDCEGGEWCIQPSELEGIKRIEAEIHSVNGENVMDFVRMLEKLGYECRSTGGGTLLNIHAKKKDSEKI